MCPLSLRLPGTKSTVIDPLAGRGGSASSGKESALPLTRLGINRVAKLLKTIQHLVGVIGPECPPGSISPQESQSVKSI